jgi:FKBP-type peptidyl-prolyl cis-trans isomerase SlyD
MNHRVVSFHYVLKNTSGETLDSSLDSEPMTFVEGRRQIIRGLEEEIVALSQGDKKLIKVEAEKGYGEYDAKLVMDLPRDQFPQDEKIEVGDQFRISLPGNPPRVVTVTALTDKHISVDGNHPLAGQELIFDVEVTQIRPAVAEDLKEHNCADHDHTH